MRLRIVVSCAVIVALLIPAVAVGSSGWTRLSPDDLSGIDQASVVTQGGRVTAAWPAGSGTALAGSIEFRGFAPTPQASLQGAGAVTVAASGYTSLAQRPALVSTDAGMRVLYGGVLPDGSSATYLSGPLQEGAGATAGPTRASGGVVGPLDAVSLPGGFLFANGENGDLHAVRDAAATDGPDLQRQLGGCCSYHPAVGADTAGRVWVAWYSNASGHIGIELQQVDPGTAAPTGTPELVPLSQSPTNNGFHLSLVCAGVCRVVYESQTSPTAAYRISSWAPGDAAPTTVSTSSGITLGTPLTAAATGDGRLWVAWYEGSAGRYVAELGDARGAGGAPIALGRPGGAVATGDLESAVAGGNLVLVGSVNTGATRSALWTRTVAAPAAIENPRTIRNGVARVVAPRGVSLARLRRSKCVRVRVSAAAPARVRVAIYSGTRSARVFGQTVLGFAAAGSRTVCVRVPMHAHTFNVRTPARIAVAVRAGARPHRGEPPPRTVSRGFRFFR